VRRTGVESINDKREGCGLRVPNTSRWHASSEAGAGITVLAVVLMLAATAVFTWLGGRVYAGAVLRSGSRVTLREALSA
jgi:hypothetical protein